MMNKRSGHMGWDNWGMDKRSMGNWGMYNWSMGNMSDWSVDYRCVDNRSMVRSRGWSMIRGRSRWVVRSRSRVIRILLMLDEGLVGADLPLVLHISVVLLVLVNEVVHDLGTAVGQLNTVLALYIVSVPGLCSGVNIRVAILIIAMHIITELVVLGSLLVVRCRGRVIRGRCRGVIRCWWRVIRCRGWVVRGWRGIGVTSIGYCHEGTD